MSFDKPYLLKENRVWRLYQGGLLIDRLRGSSSPCDGFFPEDWVGSVTRAVNQGREHLKDEGLSRIVVHGNEPFLSDILQDEQAAMDFFGPSHVNKYGSSSEILVKLLDSKVRLPLQTHPDREFAKTHLNSNYGKTECWIILGTREIDGEKPYLLFGFREGVTQEKFDAAYKTQDIQGMISMLNRIEVQPGDVFIIPANLIHAIGAGVFLAEIQEPSDHVFQFDKQGPCWNLKDYEVHMNLGDEIMLSTIRYDTFGDRVSRKYSSRFDITTTKEGVQSILPKSIHEYFRCDCITAAHFEKNESSFRVGIVVAGSGTVGNNNGSITVKPGDTYVIPFRAETILYSSSKVCQPLKIIEALPPAKSTENTEAGI